MLSMNMTNLKQAYASEDSIYFCSKFKDSAVRVDHVTGCFFNSWIKVLLFYLATTTSLILKYASGTDLQHLSDDQLQLDARQETALKSLCAKDVSELQCFRECKRLRRPSRWLLVHKHLTTEFPSLACCSVADLRRHVNIAGDHVFASRMGEPLLKSKLADVIESVCGVRGMAITEVRRYQLHTHTHMHAHTYHNQSK